LVLKTPLNQENPKKQRRIKFKLVLPKTSKMRKLLTLLLLTGSLLSYAQNNFRGYFGIEPSVYFNSQSDPAFGVNFSGSGELAKDLFAGLQVGVVKFKENDKVYIPLQVKLTIAPDYYKKKTSILILLEPGYGVYNETNRVGIDDIQTLGGFTFFGGLGAAFKGKGNGRISVAVGYSLFGFKSNDTKNNTEMIGMRLGVMF
jgi:hypothetical protein